jgi:predicted ATPase
VYLVNLASIGSVDLLASSIMQALGIPLHHFSDTHPGVQLVNALRAKSLLLLLDNFEHLLGATPLVARLLSAAPGLKVLVTSRARLSLQEEWLLPLRGLAFPPRSEVDQPDVQFSPDRTTNASEGSGSVLEGYAAIQLFTQAARRVHPSFSLRTAGPASVARICQLVEGMPLAIELAAPWARLLSCHDIAQEIEGNIEFLSSSLDGVPARHRSMRAVFDHSWNLLSDEQRGVLARLSVFRGGFDRQAAEAVAGANLGALSSLVDRSWVRATSSGRYQMHELVRQYSAEQLVATLEIRDRHSEYYTRVLGEREERLRGVGQPEALAEVLRDMDNVRNAWYWAVERGHAQAIKRSLAALWLVGETRCWYHEMQQIFGAAVTRLRQDVSSANPGGREPEQESVLLLAEALAMQAYFSHRIAALEETQAQCQESLDLLATLPPGRRQDVACADAKLTLGWVLLGMGRNAEAVSYFQEALELTRRAGDAWIEGRDCILLGYHAWQVGEYREAEKYLRQGIAASDRMGELQSKAWKLHTLAGSLAAEGLYPEAQEAAEEALRIHRQMGDRAGLGHAIMALGDVDAGLGRYDQAVERYEKGLEVANDVNARTERSWALARQGWLSMEHGRHVEAVQKFKGALDIARAGEQTHRWRAVDALVGLGHAACALGEREPSREYLCQALKESIEPGYRPEALNALVGLAGVHIQEADTDTALELLALVIQHPASSQMTRNRGRRLLFQLETEMPPEVFAAATARGRERELENAVAEELAAR